MALPFQHKFSVGRGSELLFNEEHTKVFESLKHLTDTPAPGQEPEAKMDRSVWIDPKTGELLVYDKAAGKWRNPYEKKFKLIEEIMSPVPPASPVEGQLWSNKGLLCQFDGTTWRPIKAMAEDGSHYSLDVFRNFLLVSPLTTVGNIVLQDEEADEYKKAERQYLQGILDAKTDSTVTGDGTKWTPDKRTELNEPVLPPFRADEKFQLLVPHIDSSRIFLDHDLDRNYDQVNSNVIQYKRGDIYNRTPSLVHVNADRLSKIEKVLIKVDRATPKIMVPHNNTEYYGFRGGSHFGDFLIPDHNDRLGDYTVIDGGILLNYDAAQNYDYVLAVTYKFGWLKTTGKMTAFDYDQKSTSYYVENYAGPMSVFVEGYNLEDPYFTEDSNGKIVTLKEDTSDLQLSMLHFPRREYGYIRQVDAGGHHGVIHLTQNYGVPVEEPDPNDPSKTIKRILSNREMIQRQMLLVFVNGQLLSPQDDGITFDRPLAEGEMATETDGGDLDIYIPGAKEDMMWSVANLADNDGYQAQTIYGHVDESGKIFYDPATFQCWEVDEIDGSYIYQTDADGVELYETDEHGEPIVELDKNGKVVYEKDKDGNVLYEEKYIKNEDGTLKLDKNGEPLTEPLLDKNGNQIPRKKRRKLRKKRIILFVDGLLVNTEEIVIDEKNRCLTVEGLKPGQEYLLIEDKKHWLYTNAKMCPALPTGHHSESMVYYNGHLICNGSAVDTNLSTAVASRDAIPNQVKYFKTYRTLHVAKEDAEGQAVTDAYGNPVIVDIPQVVAREYRVYNAIYDRWETITTEEARGLDDVCHSYDNTVSGIRMNMGYDPKDNVRIYAFSYACDVQHPLKVFNEVMTRRMLRENNGVIQTRADYIYGHNTLRVWANGIRQYPKTEDGGIGVKEYLDGDRFKLPGDYLAQVPLTSGQVENLKRERQHYEALKESVKASVNVDAAYENVLLQFDKMIADQTELEDCYQMLYRNVVEYLESWEGDTIPAGDEAKFLEGLRDILKIEREQEDTALAYITYAIEMPEDDKSEPCTVEVLDHRNVRPGYINMYTTKLPLYPGRATVYVNGIRQPQEAFSLLDNHTLLIRGTTQLIGATNNYPQQEIIYGDNHRFIQHYTSDKILVEVRQDNRQEQTIITKDHPMYEIDVQRYDLRTSVLEASDEVMIFVNGLYFGPKLHSGYELLVSRGSIMINDDTIREIMNTDDEYRVLTSQVGLRDYYKNERREDKQQANSIITLEWR